MAREFPASCIFVTSGSAETRVKRDSAAGTGRQSQGSSRTLTICGPVEEVAPDVRAVQRCAKSCGCLPAALESRKTADRFATLAKAQCGWTMHRDFPVEGGQYAEHLISCGRAGERGKPVPEHAPGRALSLPFGALSRTHAQTRGRTAVSQAWPFRLLPCRRYRNLVAGHRQWLSQRCLSVGGVSPPRHRRALFAGDCCRSV